MNKNNDRKIYINDIDQNYTFSNKFPKKKISFNRVAFIFFLFLIVSIIFSVKIFYYGSFSNNKMLVENTIIKNEIRSDIVDRNGNFLAKTVLTNNIGINPQLETDKKKLFIKLKFLFPDFSLNQFNNKFEKKNFFMLKKNYLLRNMIK